MAGQANGYVEHHETVQDHAPNHGLGVKKPAKLILCFDGTGNKFTGTPEDTNIVKLYQKFDRKATDQYHYYQPGIGTYAAGEASLNAGVFGRFQRWLSKTIDLGVGTTFDQHVIAGYRFIMRYYGNDDQIYIFGFSRGAFTARFLARMISHVGLLSMGNEEMVPFAYQTYQNYEMGIGHQTPDEATRFMTNFKTTFCRTYTQVHFLGLFDTVSSIGYFDLPFQKKCYAPFVLGTAAHVRHAVSIDERRMKFKPALLAQDQMKAKEQDETVRIQEEADKKEALAAQAQKKAKAPQAEAATKHANHDHKVKEDIVEKFFPGNHGDVGGGWSPNENARNDDPGFDPNDSKRFEDPVYLAEVEAGDPVQLSDITLKWMIEELDKVEEYHPEVKIAWNHHRDIFMKNIGDHYHQAVTAEIHDLLKFGGWSNWRKWPKTLMWQIAEWCPLFKRQELKNGIWHDQYFPPNMGGTRDIPVYELEVEHDHFHQSVEDRILKQENELKPAARLYRPQNDGIVNFVADKRHLPRPKPREPTWWDKTAGYFERRGYWLLGSG